MVEERIGDGAGDSIDILATLSKEGMGARALGVGAQVSVEAEQLTAAPSKVAMTVVRASTSNMRSRRAGSRMCI